MANPTSRLTMAAGAILAAIRGRKPGSKIPFLIALDGGSGAGKSTLAMLIAEELDAALIQSDDFFAAEISHAAWEARTPAEKVRDAIEWRRLRAEAIEPLLTGKPARWHAFDFESVRPDGTYALRKDFVERQPSDVIMLDGAYSSRPELADLIGLSVLVDVPIAVRHQRLAARESGAFLDSWHARWDAAEEYYFTQVRPKASFDLVVSP